MRTPIMFHCFVIVVYIVYTLAVEPLAYPNCLHPPEHDHVTNCCVKNGYLRDIVIKCNQKNPIQVAVMNFCHGECVFNETEMLVNGVVQADKLVAIAKDLFKDTPELMPVVDAAMKKCKNVAEAKLTKINEIKPDGVDKCHPLPALILSCFISEIFINCPASLWKSNEHCNQAKQFMTICIMNQGPRV